MVLAGLLMYPAAIAAADGETNASTASGNEVSRSSADDGPAEKPPSINGAETTAHEEPSPTHEETTRHEETPTQQETGPFDSGEESDDPPADDVTSPEVPQQQEQREELPAFQPPVLNPVVNMDGLSDAIANAAANTPDTASNAAGSDVGGSEHDAAADAVAATAPDVPATVEASPTAAEVAPQTPPAANVGAAAATAIAPAPAAVELAPVAAGAAPEVVALPATDSVSVLQVVLTSFTTLIIAPIAEVSSWFGTAWSQTDSVAQPRANRRWSAVGMTSKADLASLLVPAGVPGAQRLGKIHGGAAPAKVGEAAALGQMLPVDEVPPTPVVASTPIAPKGLTGFVRRAVDELVQHPSLMVLFVAALPGLAGLVAVSSFGVRVGYCQAKAGLALRASGLARYARLGPIGVVRTGSLIALRSSSSPRHTLKEAA